MSINLWMAKHIHRRIEKYEKYIIKIKGLLKRDKRLLQEYLNDLDIKEFFQFGADTGYIPKRRKK